jgi:hypothetical protein
MGRHSGRDRQARSHIAYLAARLIAEDGVQDYATAKRKAARQAGITDTSELPDNQEIETALRTYQALYQADEQPQILRELREIALTAMELLKDFNPHLTGSVLTGTAGAHSDINIQLFADSAKDFEIFLLNRNLRYDSGQRPFRIGERHDVRPVYRLEVEGAVVQVVVFERDDQRVLLKYRSDGRPIERARMEEVRTLLKDATQDPPPPSA